MGSIDSDAAWLRLFDAGQRAKLETFDVLATGIWVTDVEAARLVWANSAGLKLWRAQSVDELWARDWDTNTPTAREQTRRAWAIATEHGPRIARRRFYPKGEPVLVDLMASAWTLANGRTDAPTIR